MLHKVCETVLGSQLKSNAAKSGFVSPLKSVLENFVRKSGNGSSASQLRSKKLAQETIKNKSSYEEKLRVQVKTILEIKNWCNI